MKQKQSCDEKEGSTRCYEDKKNIFDNPEIMPQMENKTPKAIYFFFHKDCAYILPKWLHFENFLIPSGSCLDGNRLWFIAGFLTKTTPVEYTIQEWFKLKTSRC